MWRWRLTAGRAVYSPSELRRHELQPAERTLACKSQESRLLHNLIRAANPLAFGRAIDTEPRGTLGSFLIAVPHAWKDLQPYFLTAVVVQQISSCALFQGLQSGMAMHQSDRVKASG
jgi:hypothetical protein